MTTTETPDAGLPELPTVDTLTVWTKTGFCPQCTGAKLHIKSKKLPYVEAGAIDTEANAALLDDFKAHKIASAPILQFPAVVIDGEVVFKAINAAGNRTDLIDLYAEKVAERDAAAVLQAA